MVTTDREEERPYQPIWMIPIAGAIVLGGLMALVAFVNYVRQPEVCQDLLWFASQICSK